MYLLYLDETIDITNQVVGIGSVLITDRKCRKFCEETENFLRKLEINHLEIHADHIWNKRGEYKKYSMDKRANITLKIARFLSNSGIARFIYTQKFINGKDKDALYLESLENLINKAVEYAKRCGGKTNKQLMLIFDRREDIKEDILEELLKQRQKIINKYKTSFFFLDCGYEGISKYSRLLQSADFISYWGRQTQIILEQSSLFKKSDHQKKVALVKEITSSWNKKIIYVK